MRLTSVLIGATLFAVAPAAPGIEPCSPRTLRPYHVSAFASGSSEGSESGAATSAASSPARSELGLHADCLAWESSLSPKAEFIGGVPLGPRVPSGAYRPQAETPQGIVRIVYSSSGVQLRSSSSGTSLFDATPGTGAFTLGATLIPAP